MPKNLVEELFEGSVKRQPDKPAGDRSPSNGLFLNASGDWRPVLHGDSWWVVGHHLAYPARDRYHAERRCQELKAVKWEHKD